MCADFLHMRKHRDEFIAGLTPEEMVIYEEQASKGLWEEAAKRIKQRVMSELRRKKRSGETQVSEAELDKLLNDMERDKDERSFNRGIETQQRIGGICRN